MRRSGSVLYGGTRSVLGLNQPSPFFIVGCGRSGTSLLRLMLDGHPKLAAASDRGTQDLVSLVARDPPFMVGPSGAAGESLNSRTLVRRTTRTPGERHDSSTFFIIGVDRSGTTLLRLMLDRHPDIAIPPESHFIPRMWACRRRYGRRGRIDHLERFLGDLAADWFFREWGVSVDAVRRELRQDARPHFGEAVEAVYRAYARKCGKARWGDKTPEYIKHVPLLGELFPASSFIHLVRDGRDVALSVLDLGRLHRHAASVGFVWARRVKRASLDGRRLGPDRFMQVRYEDLVRDPHSELMRICMFLGSPFHPAMLEHDAEGLLKIPARFRHVHSRLSLPPTTGLRDWRRDMQSSQVMEFEAIAGRELSAMGYERRIPRPPIKPRLTAWYRVALFSLSILRRRARRRVQQIFGARGE